jgi:DNA polymerase I-like protein with 3'-5' exonuclease and polymerase domains
MKIVLDIETNSKHNKIWLAVTRNIDTGEVKSWKEASGLQKYLDSCDLIIMHNGISFDAPVLRETWKISIMPSQVCDTLVLSRLLSPSLDGGHGLESWGKRLGFPKGEFNDWDGGLTPEMEEYCIQDTLVTQKLYEHLTSELKLNKFDQRSIDLEHKVQAIIAKQERNGFKLDEVAGITLLSTLQNKLAVIETELQSIFPAKTIERISEKTGKLLKAKVEVFNPGSRKQIGERLIEKGWQPSRYTETGQPIVDEGTLDGVDIPEAKAINEYLMLQKRVAQIESWLKAVGSDGRVHGKVITNGAVTGRMTHMSPNMAQVPNSGSPYGIECRSLWIVDKGKKLVGVDASGLELRMLAHYMKDDSYAREIVSGDIHWTNTLALGFFPATTKRDKENHEHEVRRNQSKTFCYAFLYGAGSSKIGKIVGGSQQEGQRLIDTFLKNTPQLKALREKVARIYTQKGQLPGLDGRKLLVRSEHSALNTLLQSAGAIVMKQALVILNDKLRRAKIDYKMVANVHDEIQYEVEEARAEEAGRLGVEAIEEAGLFFDLRCPLTGEAHIGDNWSMTH